MSRHLEAFIEHFIYLAEQQKLDHLGERKKLKEKLAQRTDRIQALESDIESLKQLNRSDPHR